MLGALAFNIEGTNAQGFVYSFNVLSESLDIASSAKFDLAADVDIDEQYIILNNEILSFNDLEPVIRFEPSSGWKNHIESEK